MSIEPRNEGGYWRIRVVNNDGRRVSHSCGHTSIVPFAEAVREAKRWIANEMDANDTGSAMPVQAWGERYIASKVNLRESSVQLLDHSLVLLCDCLGGRKPLSAVTGADARTFSVWLAKRTHHAKPPVVAANGTILRAGAEGRTLSMNTVRKHIRNARAIFQAAVDDGLIQRSPFAKVVGTVVKTTKDWARLDDDAMTKILAACEKVWCADDGHERQKAVHAHRCLFALCRWAGLRSAEARLLARSDVNDAMTLLTVRPPSATETTKHRLRVTPIQPRLRAVLKAALDNDPKLTRWADVLENNLDRRLRAVVKHAGLPDYAKPLHTLRKNLVTEWLRDHPLPKVCHWLGMSPNVAMQHYDRSEDKDFCAVHGMSDGRSVAETDPAHTNIPDEPAAIPAVTGV